MARSLPGNMAMPAHSNATVTKVEPRQEERQDTTRTERASHRSGDPYERRERIRRRTIGDPT